MTSWKSDHEPSLDWLIRRVAFSNQINYTEMIQGIPYPKMAEDFKFPSGYLT